MSQLLHKINWSTIQQSPLLMAGVALALFSLLSLVSEKIPCGGGLGWDGASYADLVRNFERIVDGSTTLTILEYNRFFPSLLCRLTLLSLDAPFSNANIITFFTWYNVVLLAAGAWLWGSLATREGFSARGQWLGFVGLFFNHASLKYNIYYATTTDVTALFLGLTMLWAYCRRSDAVLSGATLAGSVTWPTLLIQGLLLLIFPARVIQEGKASRQSAVITTLFMGYLAIRFLATGVKPFPETVSPQLGASVEFAYLWLAFFCILNCRSLYSPNFLYRSLQPLRLLAAVVAIMAIPLLLWKLTGFRLQLMSEGERYIFQAVQHGMKFPGEFIVSHTLYFGPWVLLLIFQFPNAAKMMRKTGLGCVLVCLLSLIQSLTPLSRQLIAAMPFFLFLLVKVFDRDPRLTNRFLLWFSVLSLVLSKYWMRFSTDPSDAERTFSFPWYVSSTGCWMPFPFYWIQGLVVLALFAGLWWVLNRPR